MKESAVLKWLKGESWLDEQERLARIKFDVNCAEIALSGDGLTSLQLNGYGRYMQGEWLNRIYPSKRK